MIVEVAILNVVPGKEAEFEAAMKAARYLIATTPGFNTIHVQRCIETPNRYLLLVDWQSVEDHTIGFRQSARYEEWRRLLHHFYDPFPIVEHYANDIFTEKQD